MVIDQDICVGCRNCVVACPYNIPGFSEHVHLSLRLQKYWMRKCRENRDKRTRRRGCLIRGSLFQIGGWRLEVRGWIKMEFAFGEFPQIDLTSNFQPLTSSVGGAGVFLRAECLSRACWQISGGRGDGCSQRVFSCSPCPPLTSEPGGALGFTRPSAVRGAGRLRHPSLALGSASAFFRTTYWIGEIE